MPEAVPAVQAELPIEPAEAPKAPETPAAQAPAAPAEGETPTGQPPEKPEPDKPGKSRFKRRLDAAYRRAAEAEARAKVLEEAYQKQNPIKDEGAPRLGDFDDVEKYAEAKAKFQAEKQLKERDEKQKQESSNAFKKRVVAEWEDKTEEVDIPDFHDRVGPLTPETPLHLAIMQSDPRVAYFLVNNPKETARIFGLDEVAQVREIGKLEAKILAEPIKPKPSTAPAPIKPVTGTADTSGEPDTQDVKKWTEWRRKQKYGKR